MAKKSVMPLVAEPNHAVSLLKRLCRRPVAYSSTGVVEVAVEVATGADEVEKTFAPVIALRRLPMAFMTPPTKSSGVDAVVVVPVEVAKVRLLSTDEERRPTAMLLISIPRCKSRNTVT